MQNVVWDIQKEDNCKSLHTVTYAESINSYMSVKFKLSPSVQTFQSYQIVLFCEMLISDHIMSMKMKRCFPPRTIVHIYLA